MEFFCRKYRKGAIRSDVEKYLSAGHLRNQGNRRSGARIYQSIPYRLRAEFRISSFTAYREYPVCSLS